MSSRVLVVGSELSLTALKIAATLPDTTLVFIHSTAAAAEHQRSLAHAMQVRSAMLQHLCAALARHAAAW